MAKEGEGLSIAHEITNCIHPKYPLRIFDTSGFDDDNTAKWLRELLKNRKGYERFKKSFTFETLFE